MINFQEKNPYKYQFNKKNSIPPSPLLFAAPGRSLCWLRATRGWIHIYAVSSCWQFSDCFQNLVNLFSRLANDTIGYIDWNPYMDQVGISSWLHTDLVVFKVAILLIVVLSPVWMYSRGGGEFYGLVVITPRPQTFLCEHDNLKNPYRIAFIFYI